MSNPLLAYYGDDFTGSTDVLEVLTLAGARTVLFIEPPTQQQLAHYGDMQAIGVAGMTRSMLPEDMESALRPAFESLKASGARHVHYKICSTFDSSPLIGSIGKAIDVGADIFRNKFIPLLVAAPALGRYTVFGNHFARMGIGSMGNIYRLDRHPSASRHPVTPADESDLRLYLSRQTARIIALMDFLQIDLPGDWPEKILQSTLSDGAEIVLFDGISQEQLFRIGQLVDRYAKKGQPLFAVGSSGIETALTGYWKKEGILNPPSSWTAPGFAGPLLVVSGSCSPVTSAQISCATTAGFADLPLDTATIATANANCSIVNETVEKVVAYLNAGESVILHTSSSDDDSRVKRTREILTTKGYTPEMINTKTAALYGDALGKIARMVSERTKLKRIVIAGGDTSSYAARAMGIEAVEMIAPLSPGAPLCKAHAPGSPIDGLQVNFKGGQVGDENYFTMMRAGNLNF